MIGEQTDDVSKLANVPKPDNELSSESRTRIFVGSAKITRLNGWLSPEGVFYGCSSDEHDVCARYLVGKIAPGELERERDQNSQFTTIREYLHDNGYAQLSHNSLILPNVSLSDKQLQKITKANLRIPIELNNLDLLQEFKGLDRAIKQNEYDNGILELIRQFINNGLKYRINDDPDKAEKLFEALTPNFEDGGAYQYSSGYERTYTYKFLYGHDFAVELIEHKHDGWSGLVYSSWVSIVPIQVMIDTTDHNPYDEDEVDVDNQASDEGEMSNLEKPKILRLPQKIKGLDKRERSCMHLNDFES